MPKVTLTESQRQCERLRNNLTVMQCRRTSTEMGKIIGRNKGTYLSRYKDPESLTLREVRLLCNKLGVDIAKFVTGEIGVG